MQKSMLSSSASSSSSLPPPLLKEGGSFSLSSSLDSSIESCDRTSPLWKEDASSSLFFSQDFSLLSKQEFVHSLAPAASSSTKDRSTNQQQEKEDEGTVLQLLSNLHIQSHLANEKIAQQESTTSRQGRTMQRWVTDPTTGHVIRLVAGCVPFLTDGRVVLVNSSKKPHQWLVPKGGWESDESLEEGAIRECFEEAGLVGILGPKLDAIIFETRKSKQQRQSSGLHKEQQQQHQEVQHVAVDEKSVQEQVQKQQVQDIKRLDTECHSGWSEMSQLSEEDHLLLEDTFTPVSTHKQIVRRMSSSLLQEEEEEEDSLFKSSSSLKHNNSNANTDKLSDLCQVTFQLSASEEPPKDSTTNNIPTDYSKASTDSNDGTLSTAALTHTHVCMTLFPLFVQEMKETWPEMYRKRCAFSIDEAIELVRSEFKPVLLQAKELGFHLIRK